MKLSSNSSIYSCTVIKLQKSGDIRGKLDPIKENSSDFGYSFPSEVMAYGQGARHRRISLQFEVISWLVDQFSY